MTTFISFAQRYYLDRTVDSTCTRCYQTVASGLPDAEALQAEAQHQCDPDVWQALQFQVDQQQWN